MTSGNMINFDYLLKYIIIGDAAVGKSNLLLRYVHGQFKPEYQLTIGVEFGAKNLNIDSKIFRIQIWDTAGQENFRSIARAYYKNSVCACVVYDISNHSSFEDIQIWIDDCTKQTAKSVLLFLIGNKSDLNDNREVSYEEGEAYAKSHKMMFLETSAKTGHNINQIFEKSVKQIAKNINNNVYDLSNDSCGIRVGVNRETFILGEGNKNEDDNKDKKKCC